MLYVDTMIRESSIHGIGCFANQHIKKGEVIWKYTPGFDQEFDINYPDILTDSAKMQFLKYAYISKVTGKYILCADDTRFFNHSKNNNIINIPFKGEQEGIDITIILSKNHEII